MYLSKNKKSGIYYIYFRKSDGKKMRYSTRTKLKKEALKFLTTFEKELQNRKPSNIITLGELRKKYLASIEVTHAKSSYRHSRKCIERLIEFIGEDVNINEIKKERVESFILDIFKRAPHSASLHLRHLKATFNKSIDWNYLKENPFRGVKLRIPENNPVFINKEELQLIVDREGNTTLKQIYLFAFYTGLRRSEILNLTWQNIDMDNKLIKVKNTDTFSTKSGRPHVLPMAKMVEDILNALNKINSSYIFNNNGEKFNPTYLTKSFKKCVRLSGLDDKIHFHTLRHSFASNLAQRGVNLYVIQKLLNHSKITTTQIYSHLLTENLEKAIKVLD